MNTNVLYLWDFASNNPDIFQECMYELSLTSSSTFKEHLGILDLVFSRLSETALKINAKNEYLGY
jgi:hypothetical protein